MRGELRAWILLGSVRSRSAPLRLTPISDLRATDLPKLQTHRAAAREQAADFGAHRVGPAPRNYFIVRVVLATTVSFAVTSCTVYVLPLARPSSSLIEMSPLSTVLL